MTSVIRLSHDGLSAGAMEACSVVPPEAVLSGSANETGAMHYESKNGKFLIGTWECTPYAETLSYPETSEFCLVISGKVALTNPDGTVQTFGPGDSYIVPKGFEGRFEVLETLRKVYVLFND
ncbi:MAG: cupin domain-containing protein [Rhizobium sp.]